MKNEYYLSNDGKTAYIKLTQGQVAIIDAENLEKIGEHRWYAAWDSTSMKYYAVTMIKIETGKQKTLGMHRLLLNPPSHLVVDHINGNSLDNKIENLRICTHAQNARNRGKQNGVKSNHKGINKKNGKYQVQITKDRIKYYIGSYDTYEEAVEAQESAGKELHGDFFRTSDVIVMERGPITKLTKLLTKEYMEGYGYVYKVPLTQGKYAIIDLEDFDLVSKWNWYTSKSPNGLSFYAIAKVIGSNGKRVATMLHRLLMNAGDDDIIDHINGNPLDNRRCNLRFSTKAQNCRNAKVRVDNSSGYKGVCKHKSDGKWYAAISAGGVRTHLGSFPTPELAYEAYCKAALELHGEFANFG